MRTGERGSPVPKRRGRDLNPRSALRRITVFETAAFDRSATPPSAGTEYRRSVRDAGDQVFALQHADAVARAREAHLVAGVARVEDLVAGLDADDVVADRGDD